MTVDQLTKYLLSLRTNARVRINSKKHTVVIRVHIELVDEIKMYLEPLQPAGILFEYKPMRLWDYWKCRKQLVVVE